MKMKKIAYLEILRPQQWYKNLLIFLPLVFSIQLIDAQLLLQNIFGFLILCMIFGVTYIMNDIIDYKKDQLHPKKVLRPLTSGRITKKQAIVYLSIILLLSEFFSFILDFEFFIVTTLIIFLTFIYSFHAKNIFLVDVFLISINYVLRAICGVFLIDVSVSPWLIMGVFFLALLLSFSKRITEVTYLQDKAIDHRKVLGEYTSKFLNFCLMITASTLIITYSIYSISGPPLINDWRLVITIPIAFFILIEYLSIALRESHKGREFNEVLFTEKKLMISIFVFVITLLVLLYLVPSDYFS